MSSWYSIGVNQSFPSIVYGQTVGLTIIIKQTGLEARQVRPPHWCQTQFSE